MLLIFVSLTGFAQQKMDIDASLEDKMTQQQDKLLELSPPESPLMTTLDSLRSFVTKKDKLVAEINDLKLKISKAVVSEEKDDLKALLLKRKQELQNVRAYLREIASGVDLSLLSNKEEEKFDFQKELFSLIKPAFDEMKEMTAHVRQKSDLKERINYYSIRLNILEQAIANIAKLQNKTDNLSIKSTLEFTKSNLERQHSDIQSDLHTYQLRLDKLLATEVSLAQSSESWFKSFFQKRGLYLTEAIILVIFIILLSNLSYSFMKRYLPGFRVQHRSFRIRIIELTQRLITLILIIIGPMVIFYLGEDWVLFSLGILVLIGLGWTLTKALPFYWKQIYLFLNIGSVREGERIFLDGLPWKVCKINMYCSFVNPVADLTMRVPIQEIVHLKSRPVNQDEPWFPCKKNDWVILSDGVRAKVIGISPELVQLVKRGGAKKTYLMSDFLNCSPLNLSADFRIKETIGISYALQADSTTIIPTILQQYIQQQIELENYTEQLLSLKVEFEHANNSSLDLVVIADFKGEVADIYNRLRRSIQRWSVDACHKNNWEIPFPQMTLHQIKS